MLSKPPPGAILDYTHPLARGLVGAWLFNEGAGLRVSDASGKGNHGTLTNGPAWVGSQRGGGLSFDGVNDHVLIPNSLSLQPANVTVSMWIYSKDNSTGSYLILKDKSSGVSFMLQNNFASNIRFGTTGGTFVTASNAALYLNWAHVVATFDGTTGYMYINGVLVNSGALNAIDYTSPAGLYISYSSSTQAAIIDDVRIYNRATNAVEVQQLYTSPYAMFPSPQYRKYFIAAAAGGVAGAIVNGGLVARGITGGRLAR